MGVTWVEVWPSPGCTGLLVPLKSTAGGIYSTCWVITLTVAPTLSPAVPRIPTQPLTTRTPSPRVTPTQTRQRQQRIACSASLFAAAATAEDERERQRFLDEIVRLNMAVAESIAARYRRRGVCDEDLTQVAYLGLVKAVRGFDPAYERDFLAYAVPTIRGEVKRYFRDHGWAIRPPRGVQEMQMELAVAVDELTNVQGRPPKPIEIAAFLHRDARDVLRAISAHGCFSPTSLDRPVSQDAQTTLGELVGAEDNESAAVEARVMLAPAIARLGERDRHVLYLRFFVGQTQQEIAEQLGVTQMQVSRLITRILRDLRGSLEQ